MLDRIKSIGKFFSSMKFGIILLIILAAACMLGSFIPQGNTLAWYTQHYSERSAALLYGLRLDDVFNSVWFLVLTVILCCNLLLCNLLHLPGLIKRWKDAADPGKTSEKALSGFRLNGSPEAVFEKLRMPKPRSAATEAGERLFSVKNRAGLLGAWICHLGILLLVIGFTMGQVTAEEYTVYGVPGQTKQVGETEYTITVNDFDIRLSESGAAQQYTSAITMRNGKTGESRSSTASVNHPASLFGFRIYQNSIGRAAKATISMDGTVRQEEVICAGDHIHVLNTPLMLYFMAYEEEYFDSGDGMMLPGYAYATYYMGEADKAGVQVEGDTALTYGSVEISFSEAQNYTLLQVKADRYSWLALLGGVILLIGLALAFYMPTKRVWADKGPDGGWTVYGESRKAGKLFSEQLAEAAELAGRCEEANEIIKRGSDENDD